MIQSPEPRILRYRLGDFEGNAIRPKRLNKSLGVRRVNDGRVGEGLGSTPFLPMVL